MARYITTLLAVLAGWAAAGWATVAWSAPPPESALVTELSVSPPWIATRTGAGDLPRETTVTFVLPAAGTVVFTVTRVAPRCAAVGRFRVRGSAGANRFLFPGRLARRLFPPGTYHLTAPHGRDRALRVPVAIVAPGVSDRERERALRRDVCRRAEAAPEDAVRATPSRPPSAEARPSETATIACLTLAIALLGAAALPLRATPGPRTAALLVAHRAALALAGAVALGASLGLYLKTLL